MDAPAFRLICGRCPEETDDERDADDPGQHIRRGLGDLNSGQPQQGNADQQHGNVTAPERMRDRTEEIVGC